MQINKPDNTLQNISVGSKEINAARVAFFLPGFVISTWAPMIPMVKARLKLEADVLGRLLLCIGISAFIFMPLAGALVQRFGCKKSRHHRCNADGTNFRAAFLPAKHLELCHCTCFFRGSYGRNGCQYEHQCRYCGKACRSQTTQRYACLLEYRLLCQRRSFQRFGIFRLKRNTHRHTTLRYRFSVTGSFRPSLTGL